MNSTTARLRRARRARTLRLAPSMRGGAGMRTPWYAHTTQCARLPLGLGHKHGERVVRE